MAKRNRRRYDDKFRASAVLMLEAAGYPETKGALMRVAGQLKMPHNTLRNWFHAKRNPVPSDVRREKKSDLIAMIRAEIGHALDEAGNARLDASYRDLIVGTGILVDKMQLLTDEPTENLKQTIKVEREPEDFDTFAKPAQRANGRSHYGVTVQHAVNGAKVGKNGSGPKADN